MRIAIFSEYYAPHNGGVEFRVRGLARALAARGHGVTVFTTGYDPALLEHEHDGDIAIERCPNGGYDRASLGMRRNPLGMLVFAVWCRARARGEFDLWLYEEWPILHALMAPAKARRRGIMDWCEHRPGMLFGLIQSLLPRCFRWNMATSDAVARSVAAAGGRPVFTIPSGIDISEFRKNDARSGLLFLGRLVRHKNLPLTIAAFERLCRCGYPGTLTIAGDGPEAETVRALVGASPYAGQIIMAGEVNAEEKVALLASAELLLLLSGREGFPVAIAEAMASGVPTVTVDLPGNGGAAAVEQYQAGLVTSAEPDTVADAVARILSDRAAWSERCVQQAASLDWNKIAEAMLEKVTR